MGVWSKDNYNVGAQTKHGCCEDAQFTLDFDAKGWFLDEDYRKGPYIKFCPFCGEKLPDITA